MAVIMSATLAALHRWRHAVRNPPDTSVRIM